MTPCPALILAALLLLGPPPSPEGESSGTADPFPALVQKIDGTEIPALAAIVGRSQTLQRKVSGGPAWATQTVLYKVREDRVAPEIVDDVRKMVNDAVKASGRYDEVPWRARSPKSLVTERQRIAVITLDYNGYLVTDHFKKDRLTVRVWICPDGPTTHLLSWLRRGNSLPEGTSVEEQRKQFQSHDLGLYYFEELPYGQLAYAICPNYEIEESLPADNPMSIQSRAFVRRNIVVEASSRALSRETKESPWTSSGPDHETWREIDRILTALDDRIKTRRR